jgi:hypothetical protein
MLGRFKQPNIYNESFEQSDYLLISNIKADILRFKGALSNAHESLDDVLYWENLVHIFSDDTKFFLKNRNRGIRIRFLTNQPKNCNGIPPAVRKLLQKDHFEVRCFTKQPWSEFAVIDGIQTGITDFFISKPNTFWTSDPRIGLVFREFFESLWLDSCELQT